MAKESKNAENSKKKPSKKKLGKGIFIFFFIGLLISFFLLSIGYIMFEYNRLAEHNLNISQSWRSYFAGITKNIPILKNYIEYEILEIGTPLFLQNQIINQRIENFHNERQELNITKEETENILRTIEEESQKLMVQREEVERMMEEYNRMIEEYNDYQRRVSTLASWFEEAAPDQIVNALVREEVSVNLIVDALLLLPADVAANILQTLARTEPAKAARIIALLGEKRSE